MVNHDFDQILEDANTAPVRLPIHAQCVHSIRNTKQ